MESWTLENTFWRIRVAALGAELSEWWDKTCNKPLLWQPCADVWNNSATQLFPVVGRLVHNGLWQQGAFWPLPAHGFLRHQLFCLESVDGNVLQLCCEDNVDTRQLWPFRWKITVRWTLTEQGLDVGWQLENMGKETFPFALGWHPGFALPIASQPGWQVQFSHPAGGPYLARDRTLHIPESVLQTRIFSLTPEAFQSGAVYFSTPDVGDICVIAPDGEVVLRLRSPDTQWLALWGKPGADLLCIEPLTGTTDDPDFDGDVAHKRGMLWLGAGECYRQRLSVILAQDAVEIDG